MYALRRPNAKINSTLEASAGRVEMSAVTTTARRDIHSKVKGDKIENKVEANGRLQIDI